MFGKILGVLCCLMVFSEGNMATNALPYKVAGIPVEFEGGPYEDAIRLSVRINFLGDDNSGITLILREFVEKWSPYKGNKSRSIYALTVVELNLSRSHCTIINEIHKIREELLCKIYHRYSNPLDLCEQVIKGSRVFFMGKIMYLDLDTIHYVINLCNDFEVRDDFRIKKMNKQLEKDFGELGVRDIPRIDLLTQPKAFQYY